MSKHVEICRNMSKSNFATDGAPYWFGALAVNKCFSQTWNLYMSERQNEIFDLDWCTSSKEVLARAKWNTLETMYEKRLLILAHQAYHHLLPCPINCLFVKYESRYQVNTISGGK